jgi:Reverse transcriptase (RNA-dependent DNA polymerase)/RNase H-like domain found in reverse transcriptase
VQLNLNEEQVLNSQLLAEGIMCAWAIIDHKAPRIGFINTTEKTYVLENFKTDLEPLSNFLIKQHIEPKPKLERSKKVLDSLNFQNVRSCIQENLMSLFRNFADIFHLDPEPITANNFYKQKITLTDDVPTYIKNYRLPQAHKEQINNEVKKLLENNIVENSVSPYNSPLLLVPKKGGEDRVVVDFRQVNKKLVADKFPLPRMDEILDELGRAKYFSVLDLKAGFHQTEILEESKKVTSFSTSSGHFHFNRLPFGLKISPNSFQRMMTIAFAGLVPDVAFLYIDDLVVLGCSEQHHLLNLSKIFKRLLDKNLKLNPLKCKFFQNSVVYLGHQITEKGIRPDPNKFETILKYPTPQNADDVRRFVAFCNYYRRFIKDFAAHATPLNNLLKKSSKFNWTESCQKSFNFFKNSLISPPILAYPDFNKEFHLTTDASDMACGAVLSQFSGNAYLPIAFASTAFTKGERNKQEILRRIREHVFYSLVRHRADP